MAGILGFSTTVADGDDRRLFERAQESRRGRDHDSRLGMSFGMRIGGSSLRYPPGAQNSPICGHVSSRGAEIEESRRSMVLF